VPILTAGAYAYAVPYGDLYVLSEGPTQGGSAVPIVESSNERYWDERIRAYAQLTHPIDEYRSVFGRWSGTSRQPLNALSDEAYRPFLPTRGFISSVGGGWRYARGRSFDASISPEQGRIVSLVGDLSAPWIGAFVLDDQDQWVGFTQLQITAEWREYRTVPWAANHVLATKLAGGVSTGDENRYGSYRLGGSFGESAYYTLPDEWRALRGFPAAVVYGDNYYLGSAEYRLPLLYVDRGVGVLPFFARGLSAAAFVDAGNAFSELTSAETMAGLRVGTGAELSASAILGWGIPVTVRLGYAFAALGDGGYAPGSLGGAYAWFGSSY
jgi:outer membrane protein assembly factor BamA